MIVSTTSWDDSEDFMSYMHEMLRTVMMNDSDR